MSTQPNPIATDPLVTSLQRDLVAHQSGGDPLVATMQADLAKQRGQGEAQRSVSIEDTLRADFAKQTGAQPGPGAAPPKPAQTIGPYQPSTWERIKNVFTQGIPQYSTRTSSNPKYGQMQIVSPEEAMTPGEQRQHPILTGTGEFAGSMTSPQNVAVLAGTGGLGSLPGAAGRLLPRLIGAGFSAGMLKSAYDQVPAIREAADRGDESEVKRLLTQFGLTLATAGLSGRYAARGQPTSAETATPEVETTPRQVRGLLPAYRQPIVTPVPPGSVIGAIDRAGPIPLEDRLPMPDLPRREVRGLLPPWIPEPTFQDTLQSYAGPSGKPLLTPEPGRTLAADEVLPQPVNRIAQAGVVTPDLLRDVFSGQLPKEAYQKFVAEPLIEKGLGIGDKYAKVREVDPTIAENLHTLDNATTYLRAKATQHIQNIVGDLSRPQERLFALMADADSRENLRTNHPQEYQQALRDPAIQAALQKYRPVEQEMTTARQRLGGQTLDQDYLRRVYEQHVAGVGQESAIGSTERGTTAFDRVIRPQRIGNLSREATAEYHYQNGLHEFGPAFGTKFIGAHLAAMRDIVARDFISKATELPVGSPEPRSITYQGQRYFRPDIAREMRDAGQKSVKAYDRYDPTAGVKYPQKGSSKFLGPAEVVRTLNDYGTRPDSGPGPVRRFFQEQVIGFGFGAPHIANIMRRVTQTAAGGAANPIAWVRAANVAFGKELRARGIAGLNDPTFDRLAQQGAISIGELANLKRYWGGNLNPANWARSLAGIGHKLIFEPGSFGGLGGFDQRARLYVADLVKSQNPRMSDAEIARAVNTQLGDYNRANWSQRQKQLSKFLLFPGWDASSIRWVIQHPIKTTVPPALLVWTANQVLNRYGQNRPEDASDISNVHIGDRSIGVGLLREPAARNLMRPAINYAQSKARGESGQRAIGEASRGVAQGAGGLLGMLRPDITAGIDLAMNRQSPFGGKELVSPGDYNKPGKILPNLGLEKQAALIVRHAFPALDRMLDSNQDIDLRSFVGGNLGLPNYRDDAEIRLRRNAAQAAQTYSTLSQLAKTNPQQARDYLRDPDNAAFALFHQHLSELSGDLRKIDQAKEIVQGSRVPDKQQRLETLDAARTEVLKNAEGLNNLLFRQRQAARGAQPRRTGVGPMNLPLPTLQEVRP